MHTTSKTGRRIELPDEEEDIETTRQAIEDGTDASEAEMRMYDPFARSDLPDSFKSSVRGRPKSDQPKVPISIRLDEDVLDAFRAKGKGWQGRINDALKEWLKEHAKG